MLANDRAVAVVAGVQEETTEELATAIREEIARNLKIGGDWLESGKRLGQMFNRLKKRTPHGQWLNVVQEFGLAQRTVNRWMRDAKKEVKLATVANLEEQLKLSLTETSDETCVPTSTNQHASVYGQTKYCSRNCRVGKGPKECKKCRNLRTPSFLQGEAPALPTQAGNTSASAGTGSPPEGQAGAGHREPGDDTTPLEEKLKKQVESAKKMWGNRITQQSRIRDVAQGVVKAVSNAFAGFMRNYEGLIAADLKPAGPPRQGTCKRCGAKVLWVTTEAGKNMALDPEPGRGGKFELINNRPVMVEYKPDLDYSRLYKSHHSWCRASE